MTGESFQWVWETERSIVGEEKIYKTCRKRKTEVLESSRFNSQEAVMLFENYRHHNDKKWQDITCPKPSQEQWDAYNTDTEKIKRGHRN